MKRPKHFLSGQRFQSISPIQSKHYILLCLSQLTSNSLDSSSRETYAKIERSHAFDQFMATFTKNLFDRVLMPQKAN